MEMFAKLSVTASIIHVFITTILSLSSLLCCFGSFSTLSQSWLKSTKNLLYTPAQQQTATNIVSDQLVNTHLAAKGPDRSQKTELKVWLLDLNSPGDQKHDSLCHHVKTWSALKQHQLNWTPPMAPEAVARGCALHTGHRVKTVNANESNSPSFCCLLPRVGTCAAGPVWRGRIWPESLPGTPQL